MKSYLQPFFAVLCLAGVMSSPAGATVNSSEVQSLQAQTRELKKTIAGLQYQVAKLERKVEGAELTAQDSYGDQTTADAKKKKKSSTKGVLTAQQLRQLIQEEHEYLPFDLDVPGQAFVSTGPYVGVPFQFAGNDLVINSPSVDTDVQLLSIRKSIMLQLRAMGGEIVKEPYHSHLLLSGVVEGSADYMDRGGSPSTTDINLSNVSLDAFFLGPSEWLLGFIEFNYVDVPPANDVFGGVSQYRVSDSRMAVNKAFVTLGNFRESPYYGTFGQFYVPFGVYSSVMVSSPLTKVLTRTKARSILLGLQQQSDNAFFASAYIFRGDSHANSVAKVNNGGLNFGYKFKGSVFRGKIGGGLIGNIADSGGMQVAAGFQNNEQLVHRVPGYNLRTVLGIGDHLDFIGEYVGASTSFNPNDMSYNGQGAKPWALDLEAAFSMDIFDGKPSSLGIGWGQSHEALALGLPLNRISVVVNTSWWRNTLQSLEVHRDREYAASDTATGAGAVAAAGETGKIDTAVIAQFDYYF